MRKIVLSCLLFLIVTFSFPISAFADCRTTPCPSPQTCQEDPQKGVYFCATSSTPSTGSVVQTALGPIPTQPAELVKWILKYAILLGGGIAFILSLWGGITIILAGGNPEKINEGKEIISSAITGLLFIIFSVFLLRFIGFDILQLPGFAK